MFRCFLRIGTVIIPVQNRENVVFYLLNSIFNDFTNSASGIKEDDVCLGYIHFNPKTQHRRVTCDVHHAKKGDYVTDCLRQSSIFLALS